MIIQYVSDLHLETIKNGRGKKLKEDSDAFWKQFVTPGEGNAAADVLILAGDIGNTSTEGARNLLDQFLAWTARHWLVVIYVPGNHEFYNTSKTCETIDVRAKVLRKLCEKHGVHLLMRETYSILGLNFIGTTLWTSPRDSDFSEFNDWRTIYVGDESDPRLLTPADMCLMSRIDKTWIAQQLAASTIAGHRAVVVTHHLPTPKMISKKYRQEPWSRMAPMFANSDMEGHIASPALTLWIAGHSHGCCCIEIAGGPTLAVNAHGYPGENVEGFLPTAMRTILT